MATSEMTIANRDGWRVVWTAFVVAMFGFGVGFYGPAVYLPALHQARGWSISTISVAITAHYLVGASLIACLPDVYRRFGVGCGLALAVSGLFGLPAIIRLWSPLVAFFVSVAVGLASGIYPARRASMLDPIEALRHE